MYHLLSIGTVNYGIHRFQDAKAQLDRFVELVEFIDTAHVYGDWVPGPRGKRKGYRRMA